MEKIDTALTILIAVVVLYLGHLLAKYLFDGRLSVTFSEQTINFDWQRKPRITTRVFRAIRIENIESYTYHNYRGYSTVKIKMCDGTSTKIESPSPSNLKNSDLGKLLNQLKTIMVSKG